MPLEPVGDSVLLRPMKLKDRTHRGLYLPRNIQEKFQVGEIVMIGPGLLQQDGSYKPITGFAVGDLAVVHTILINTQDFEKALGWNEIIYWQVHAREICFKITGEDRDKYEYEQEDPEDPEDRGGNGSSAG